MIIVPSEPPPPVAPADGETLDDLGIVTEPDPVPTDTPPAPPTTEGPSV